MREGILKTCEICGLKERHSDSVKEIYFASFPIDENRCREWVKVVGKEYLVCVPIEKLNELKHVCSNHFKKEDFHIFRGKPCLSYKNAIPSKNLVLPPLSENRLKEFPLHVFKPRTGQQGEGTSTGQATQQPDIERSRGRRRRRPSGQPSASSAVDQKIETCAAIEILPMELLLYVFGYLNETDLLSCSKVCWRWWEASESCWQRFCTQNHWCTRTEAEKKSLPENYNSLCPLYSDLYRSLSLWPDIKTATVYSEICPFMNGSTGSGRRRAVVDYKILNNNTLAVLPDNGNGVNSFINYYDLETFEKCNELKFHFTFHMYDENEAMVTVVNSVFGRSKDEERHCLNYGGKLYVMLKESMTCILIGKIFGFSEYKLLEDRVFFVNDDNCLSVAMYDRDSLTVETTVLDGVNRMWTVPKNFDNVMYDCLHRNNTDDILAFGVCDSENLYCISIQAAIYNYTSLEGVVKCLHRLNDGEFVRDFLCLRSYGFDWSHPWLYNWLKRWRHRTDVDSESSVEYATESECSLAKNITRQTAIAEEFAQCICRHGHIVVIVVYNQIHIYVNPFDKNGNITLGYSEPDRSIDIQEFLGKTEDYKTIKKIDIIEVENGHRLLILYGTELVRLDLVHEDYVNVELFEIINSRKKTTEASRKKKKKNCVLQ